MPIVIANGIEWALRNWKIVLGGLAVAALALMLVLARGDVRHFSKLYDQEKAAHVQTVANYRAAADEAKRLDQANVARVTKEQQQITERTVDAYHVQLADSASRYERLRAKASGYLSRPGPAGLPDTRETTCRTVAGADCDAIPAILKAAQDNTDQLIALQAWTRSQAAVDMNGAR